MILLIVAAVLIGLFWLPIGIRAVYHEENPVVWLLIGPIRFTLYPKKTKTQRPPKVSMQKHTGKDEQGESNENFLEVIRGVMEFLSHFRRKLLVKHLELKVTLAGDDPADLAVNYGRAWAALGSFMPQLDQLFAIKKRNVEVRCDFTADRTRIYGQIDASITLGRALYLLSHHGIKILKHLFNVKNLRKGGAQL